MVRTRPFRVGPSWQQLDRKFKTELPPIIGRKVTSSEISDRVARFMLEERYAEQFIRATKRKPQSNRQGFFW